MEGVREYLLAVTAAAVLCGIIRCLAGENGALASISKMLCGLFLTTVVISPVAKVNIQDISQVALDMLVEGQQAAQEGEISYDQTIRQIITDETRAYIMDKARAYGAEIQVEITLSEGDPPIPESCVISGAVSPYVKQQLTKMLIADLNIPEDNQIWMRCNK